MSKSLAQGIRLNPAAGKTGFNLNQELIDIHDSAWVEQVEIRIQRKREDDLIDDLLWACCVICFLVGLGVWLGAV